MQNPASPPNFRRTCPTCNRPVEPGYKFCETCGTRIPVLSTCSKCGTQFITPSRYCDLCGAPLILGEVAEPENPAEHDEEEPFGPAEDQVPERDDEEIPEPDTDRLPEDNDEENLVPAEDETPHHYKKEIQEPDTDELLEKYGKEYDVDETLESRRRQKSRSPVYPDVKKPARVLPLSDRVSPETVDDALFLSPGKPEAKAGSRVNKTWIIGGCLVLIAIIAVIYFIGLPMITGNGGFATHSSPAGTPLPEPTIMGTIRPTPAPTSIPVSSALVPKPTQTIPTDQKLYFRVQKSPITAKILVTFAGSAGHGSIKSADITVTHPDRSVSTGIILPLKGVTEITLQGSKETDRVEIIALMSDGGTYRVYDELVPLPL